MKIIKILVRDNGYWGLGENNSYREEWRILGYYKEKVKIRFVYGLDLWCERKEELRVIWGLRELLDF